MKILRRRKTLGAAVGAVGLLAMNANAAGSSPAVYGESATVKVRPNAEPKSASTLTLAGARNEFVSFQVVVNGGASGVKNVHATFSGLTGSGTIQGDDLTLYRETYLNIKHVSTPDSSTGQWPDGLIPDVDPIVHEQRKAFPFDVPANESRAIWVDVHVPESASPGNYQGQVVVQGDGGLSQTVAVTLQVLPATLPSTSSVASAFLIFDGNVCRAHTGKSDCGSDASRNAIVGAYEQLALDHRITLSNIGRLSDYGAFDSFVGPYMEGTAPTQLAGAKMTTIQFTGKRQPDAYAAFEDNLSQQGWLDRGYDYTGDEPPYGISYADIATREKLVAQNAPHLSRLVTTNIDNATQNGIVDGIDTMVPVINQMDGVEDKYLGDQRSKYDAFLSQTGKKLWLYESCMSHGCGYGTNALGNSAAGGWPTYVVDAPASRNRAMQWELFLEKATGELYYETANMLPSAWSDQYSFGGNGDGNLFYPGTVAKIGGTTDIPLPSIRLQLIRMGMQDYEWLKLVSDAGDPDFARQVASKLLPSASQVPADGTAFDEARAQLEQRYVELTGQSTPAPIPTSPTGATGTGLTQSDTGGSKGCGGSGPGGAAASLALPLFLLRRRRRKQA